MSRFESDTIKRQVRQLGEMIAALVAQVYEDHDYETGLEAIRVAAAKGLGPDRTLLDRLDPASAVALLREPERALVYAQVCAAEAEMMAGLGRSADAARLRARAAQVESAARPGGPGAA